MSETEEKDTYNWRGPRLCIGLTEPQRVELYKIFTGKRGMQQRTMTHIIDRVIALAKDNPDKFMAKVFMREVDVVYKESVE